MSDHISKSLSFPVGQLSDFQQLADRLSGSAVGKGNLSMLLRFAVETTYRDDLARIRAERLLAEEKMAPKRSTIKL